MRLQKISLGINAQLEGVLKKHNRSFSLMGLIMHIAIVHDKSYIEKRLNVKMKSR